MKLVENVKKSTEKIWIAAMVYLTRRAFTHAYAQAPKIAPGSKILDMGCGSGIVGYTISKIYKSSVIGCDLKDQRRVPMEFVTIDGNTLPFKDNSFDLVLVFFVLHHINKEDQEVFLKEAYRVSKRFLVVAEDTPRNFLEVISCKRHLGTYRLFRSHVKDYGGVRLKEDWEEFFAKLHMNRTKSFSIITFNPRHFTTRTAFVIEKNIAKK